MSELYLIRYPATLPKEGTVPVKEKIMALTNHLPAPKVVGLKPKGVQVPGWTIKDISDMTVEEAIEEYKVDDGDPVEIEEGAEWDCYEKGRWATPGLLARIKLTRVYKIPYRTSARGSFLDGYTNEFHIANEFDEAVSCPPLTFKENHWNVAENEKELQKAKKSDGGAVPLNKDIAKGPDGWITTGFQDAYLRLLAQRKTSKDKTVVEVGGKTKSPGVFQRLLGGGKQPKV